MRSQHYTWLLVYSSSTHTIWGIINFFCTKCAGRVTSWSLILRIRVLFRGLPLQAPQIKANGTTHRVYWREFIVQMCHGTLSMCPRRHCMRKTLAVNTVSFRPLVRLTDDCCARSHAFRISSSRRLLCPVNHKGWSRSLIWPLFVLKISSCALNFILTKSSSWRRFVLYY